MTLPADEPHTLPGANHDRPDVISTGRAIPWLLIVGLMVVPAAILCCTVVSNSSVAAAMPWLFLSASMTMSAWSIKRCWSRRNKSHTNSALVPLIVGASFIPIVIIPVTAQASGSTTSKLKPTGLVPATDLSSNILPIVLLSSSIIIVGIAAMVGGAFGGFPRLRQWGFGKSFNLANLDRLRWTHTVFLAVGFAGFVLTQISDSGDLESRGAVQGAGLSVMLSWALPLAVAMGFAYRNFGDRWRFWVSVLGVILLALGDVRSPVLLVFIAIVVGAINNTEFYDRPRSRIRQPGLRVALLLALAVVTALVSAYISSWRGARIRNRDVSATEVLSEVLRDPFNYVALSGLDSYDGIRLALAARDAGYEASVFDPLKGIVNLVPRFVYPDKQGWLGNDLSLNFLGWDKGGIFLSGIGYFYVVFGGMAIALAAMALTGMAVGFIEARAGSNMMAVTLCCYFILRFLMGGDAFDLQHVLMLCLVCLATANVARFLEVTLRLAHRHREELLNVA